jgi:hypothetical protein
MRDGERGRVGGGVAAWVWERSEPVGRPSGFVVDGAPIQLFRLRNDLLIFLTLSKKDINMYDIK